MRICCSFLAFVLLVSLLPYTALADANLPIKIGKVTDFDKLHQAFDYPSGAMVASGGDFWIADSSASRPQSIAHVWESPGIMDMGAVDFNSISEAPLTGYQGEVSVSEGHIYVTISRGCYGKFRIDDIIKPGDRASMAVAEFSITYAYQSNGSRSLVTGTSSSTTTATATTPAATSTTASTGSGVYENYRGSPDIGSDVRMQYWHGQTFTALSSHAVSGVRLMAYRIGIPGSLIVSVRATNSSGHPSGGDLAYGSTSGDTLPLSLPGEWREITFTQPVNLTTGVKYTLVVRAPGGGGGNVVKWQTDSSAPDYTGGARESSGDSGATWQTDTSADYLFEIIGSGPGAVPTVDTGGSSTSGGSSSTGSSTSSGGGGTSTSLPPGVWTSWDSNTSRWVTIGPSQICVDTTSNGFDMGAKTQRTYGTDCNYVVEFDFTMSQEGRVRMWQDGFAFVTLNFGNMITLMSGNYQSYEITKTKLSPNRWYRIRVDVIKDANTGFGKYDVYVDGQYAGSKTSSEFDMIRECGGKCILMGKWDGYNLDRTKCCWKNINVTVGGNPGTSTGSGTGTTTGPATGGGTGATTGATTGTGTGTGTGTTAGTMLAAGSRTAVPNSTVQVPVNLMNAHSMGSMNFILTYDPQVLKVNRVDGGSMVSGTLFTPNYQAPPEVRFGLAATGGINGSGTISYIEFQVIGNAGGSSPLKISEVSVNNTSGQPVSVNSQDGLVTITVSKIKGDYNGDGKLSEVDALAALKMSVKLMTEDLTLDLDGNGKVTAEDARLILKKALGK